MSLRISLLLAGLLASSAPLAQRAPAAPATAAEPPPALSTAAERVYEMAKPRILQIRTLLQAAGRQTSLGSGFLVTAEGLAITNYHVVSRFALDPKTYRLGFPPPDRRQRSGQLLAGRGPPEPTVGHIRRIGMRFF